MIKTKQELLNHFSDINTMYNNPFMYQTLSNMIDELFEQPFNDCISKEKALEQTEWIPVSERLPEKHGCYLVTTKWKGSYSGDVYIETNMAVYREKQKEWDCADVIAWKPLPEPYKAESEE